ncbi:hypothetical protein [Proteiniborus sp. MB09-C3]|uniref:hypothetical protein n=1 Tax=Proteiniborus sp. MB09-C3 TaxID=3050072 RepID=UPI00255365D4|nr:hypothetical protein [Proteiniborus sp. MB09-C3]WIV12250.1 hypothetical protein QO263_00575 [Proteiniborus sp. MB09-C3]
MKKSILNKKIIMFLLILTLVFTAVAYGAENNAQPLRTGYIEGYIKEINSETVTIERYEGGTYKIQLPNTANLLIDGHQAQRIDFKPGMEVYAEIRGRSIQYMDSFSTLNPGYIKPGSKMRTGTIKTIDRNQIIIKTSIGNDETYYFSPATIAIKKGENVPLSVLYVGDRVKLHFDDINTDIVSRISIEGDSIKIQNLYKGKLAAVDELENTIFLENVKTLVEGKWEDTKGGLRISYSSDSPIYIEGYVVPSNNLKYYKGKEVYAAIKNFFGQEKIERLVVKGAYETTYSEKIKDINWFSENLELGNNKNIEFNDGTIIVKSDRLVDKYSLNPKSDGFFIANGKGGGLTADVIYIYNEDINNSNIGQNNVYVARLDEIVENTVKLKNPFLVVKHQWEGFEDIKELYYDNDTFIYDLEKDKLITSKEFYTKDYAVDEKSRHAKDNRLRDWHGYIYTDGDHISVIGVQKEMDSLLKQRMTIGIVESASDSNILGKEMIIREAKDWSARHEKWIPKEMSLKVSLNKAIIIKQDKLITYQDLKPGDNVYVIRDDYKGKVVIVK